ncbi:MAG: molybdopterin molybdotransferase MoeA [Phycisphaeraceae bacterium]|nr:molybdopterin molybdotransferase MoeA [Phycisphaeraceae bacterium]
MSTKETPFRFNSPAAALGELLRRLPRVSQERVALGRTAGRFLAEAVHADRPSPALDVSVMDGYAARLEDLARGTLPVRGDALIGKPPIVLEAGSAARIVTGAPVPRGADCVIRVEDTTSAEDRISFDPSIGASLPTNRFIRRQGENATAGAEILTAGTCITPTVASALASFGIATPLVYRRLRIGILSTGDEVLPAEAMPQPWQLRDGNGAALEGLFSSLGFVESVEVRHAPDDQARILASASELLSRSDALFLSGGVSMGHRDLVPAALAQLGATTVFHKVPQRPGKPILAATGPRDQLILGLPGNPVSVLVTAHRFAVPALEHIGGSATLRPVPSIAIESPDEQTIPLWWHRIVRVNEAGRGEFVENKGSGDLIASARSDGFVEIPPGTCGAGSWPFYLWRC